MKSARGFAPIIIIAIVISLASVITAWFAYQKFGKPIPSSSPTPSSGSESITDKITNDVYPSPSTPPKIPENWKTYRSNTLHIQFEYPKDYKTLEETLSKVVLGTGSGNLTTTILTITSNKGAFTDYSRYKPCASGPEPAECVGPQIKVEVDGKNATQFAYTKGINTVFQVIQTPVPQLEIKMLISGGGLTTVLDQILASIKLLP